MTARSRPSGGHPDSGGLLGSGDRPNLHFSERARAALTRWYQNRAKFRFPDSGSMMFSESTLTVVGSSKTRKAHGVAHLMKSISGSGRPMLPDVTGRTSENNPELHPTGRVLPRQAAPTSGLRVVQLDGFEAIESNDA
jgi:hypothetical protein